MKLTLLAIAGAFVAIGQAISKDLGETPESAALGSLAPTGEDTPKKRGPKPATPAAEPEKPAGMSDEERLKKNMALIQPLVECEKGEEVKKISAKYSPTGKLKDLPVDKQAAWEKDIDALSY